MQRRRRRDRVHAVERVGHVDEPALLADRVDRLGEGHAARDLLPRKSPITSPWSSVFTSSPGITIRSRPARALDRLERAAEDVVVGDRDRAEPLASAWSSSSSTSIEQSCDQVVCMCRSVRIQGRSASGSARGRRGSGASREVGVELASSAARAAKLSASARVRASAPVARGVRRPREPCGRGAASSGCS